MSREIDFSKQLTEDEAAYVNQRPWMIVDARLRGQEIQWPEEAAEDDAEPEEEEDVEYADLSVAELKAEIKARNQEPGATEIIPAGTKKADLVFALEQDDVRSANSADLANFPPEPDDEPEDSDEEPEDDEPED